MAVRTRPRRRDNGSRAAGALPDTGVEVELNMSKGIRANRHLMGLVRGAEKRGCGVGNDEVGPGSQLDQEVTGRVASKPRDWLLTGSDLEARTEGRVARLALSTNRHNRATPDDSLQAGRQDTHAGCGLAAGAGGHGKSNEGMGKESGRHSTSGDQPAVQGLHPAREPQSYPVSYSQQRRGGSEGGAADRAGTEDRDSISGLEADPCHKSRRPRPADTSGGEVTGSAWRKKRANRRPVSVMR